MPAMRALALFEGVTIIVQAGSIALLAQAVFIEHQSVDSQTSVLLALLAALLLRAGTNALRQWLAAGASATIRLDVRQRLLAAIRRAGPASIESGDALLPVFDEQIQALDGFYAKFMVQRVAATIIPFLVVIVVFWNDWLAGLLLLLSAPLIPVFMILIGMGAEKLAHAQHQSLARMTGWFGDQLAGAATLRLFGAESDALERVQLRTDDLRQATMKVLRLAFLSSAVLEFFASVAIAAVAIYVGLGLLGALHFGPAPSLTLQSGLFVLLLAPEFFAPLRTASQGWHDRADALAAAASIRRVLAWPIARPDADETFRPAPPDRCDVSLRQISLAYPGRPPLFQKLDLEIPAGQRLVLIGSSGAGKSSLLSMLAGFVAPDAGDILLSGQPLARMADSCRAGHVAWLGQQPYLFAGSLADNIALGKADATRDEIEHAARLARVDEFAACYESGLDHEIGEGGYGLSGGQAQRLALARALLRPRPLILLDEPTAHLDPGSEAEVLTALQQALTERPLTVVCATHRPAWMAWADRVIAVENGTLREVRA